MIRFVLIRDPRSSLLVRVRSDTTLECKTQHQTKQRRIANLIIVERIHFDDVCYVCLFSCTILLGKWMVVGNHGTEKGGCMFGIQRSESKDTAVESYTEQPEHYKTGKTMEKEYNQPRFLAARRVHRELYHVTN